MEVVQSDQHPQVSVVIPAYNTAGMIADCLNSVLAQSFEDFEIIVVNDGSPDTEALECALRPYESRIQYVKQENRGPSAARNLGILRARGKYIAFLDSDDTWFPDHLAEQMAMLLENPSIDLIYADAVLVRDGAQVGHAFGLEPQHPPVTFEKLLTTECIVGTSSTVALRQSLIDGGLFDERFRICEDFDLWLRMAFRGAQISLHRGLHVFHKLSSESLSGDRYAMTRARIEVYRKAASTLPVTAAQKELIAGLIAKNEAKCDTDLAKRFLQAGEYAKALEAAQRASVVRNDWKMRTTVLALRRIPNIFRYYHLVYERILEIRNRLRRMSFNERLKISGAVYEAKPVGRYR
jgi:glycosyltransferase involved in cell wall biosynthesis